MHAFWCGLPTKVFFPLSLGNLLPQTVPSLLLGKHSWHSNTRKHRRGKLLMKKIKKKKTWKPRERDSFTAEFHKAAYKMNVLPFQRLAMRRGFKGRFPEHLSMTWKVFRCTQDCDAHFSLNAAFGGFVCMWVTFMSTPWTTSFSLFWIY